MKCFSKVQCVKYAAAAAAAGVGLHVDMTTHVSRFLTFWPHVRWTLIRLHISFSRQIKYWCIVSCHRQFSENHEKLTNTAASSNCYLNNKVTDNQQLASIFTDRCHHGTFQLDRFTLLRRYSQYLVVVGFIKCYSLRIVKDTQQMCLKQTNKSHASASTD